MMHAGWKGLTLFVFGCALWIVASAVGSFATVEGTVLAIPSLCFAAHGYKRLSRYSRGEGR